VVDDFEEHDSVHLRGKVGRELVEAIVRPQDSVALYSINGSKVYSVDLAPTTLKESRIVAGLVTADSEDATHWSSSLPG
jgi:hypothetical protein